MNHLFFVTSTSEAEESLEKIKRLPSTDSFRLVSNNPLANLFFTNRQIPFQDSGNFFSAKDDFRSRQVKITDISKRWAKLSGINPLLKYRGFQLDDIVAFSLFIYLAEVEHSLLVAQNILRTFNPDIVHVGRHWTESPFRRYQTENLNLENLALDGLSRLNRVKINPLSQESNVMFLITSFALKQLSKLANLRVRLLPRRGGANEQISDPSSISPLVILANYYQLANLFPFLSKLTADNLGFTSVGKIDPKQLELLNKSAVPFFPIGSARTISSLPQTIRYFYLWHRLKPKLKRLFISHHPLYWNLIKEKLRYLFTIEFPQITGYLDQAEKIFCHHPKILLTMASNDTFSRCFVESATHHKTKVIELQHGLVIFDEEASFRKNDIHAVWGTPVAKIMSQGDRNSNSMTVTGFPYFDKYRKKVSLGRLPRRNKEKTILVLATFPIAADRLIAIASPYRFLEIIFNVVKSQDEGWKIIFRPHPSSNASWVKDMAKNFSIDLIFDQRKTPLDKSISSCNLVISNFTTAMVDAMFIGKPILLYSFADTGTIKLTRHPLIATGATRTFSSIQELLSLMNKIKQKRFVNTLLSGQKEFLKSYCSANNETASSRLFGLIKKTLI